MKLTMQDEAAAAAAAAQYARIGKLTFFSWATFEVSHDIIG